MDEEKNLKYSLNKKSLGILLGIFFLVMFNIIGSRIIESEKKNLQMAVALIEKQSRLIHSGILHTQHLINSKNEVKSIEYLKKIESIFLELERVDRTLVTMGSSIPFGNAVNDIYKKGDKAPRVTVQHLTEQIKHAHNLPKSERHSENVLLEQLIHGSSEHLSTLEVGQQKFSNEHSTLSNRHNFFISFIFGSIFLFGVYYIKFFLFPLISNIIEGDEMKEKTAIILDETEKYFHVGHWEYNVETGVTIWSPELIHIYDWGKMKLPKNLKEEIVIYNSEHGELLEEALFDMSEGKINILDLELNLTTPSGRNRWVHIQGKPFLKEGKVTKILATIEDITSRRTAENRFQRLFRCTKLGIFIIGDGKILDCNPIAMKMLMVESKEEIVQQHLALYSPLYQLDGKSSLDKIKAIFGHEGHEVRNEVSEGEESSSFSWVFKTADGNEIKLDVKSIPIEMGEKKSYLMACQDPTEIYEYEKKVIQANSKAQKALRLKSEFISTVNNEILEPLRILERRLEDKTIVPAIKPNDEVKKINEYFKIVLDDIVQLTKIERGNLNTDPFPYNFNEQIKLVLDYFSVKANEKKLKILNVPNFDLNENFFGNATKLRQILYYLIENSIKYTESGHVKINIDSEKINQHQIGVNFTISDTGVGMSEELIKNSLRDTSLTERSEAIKNNKRIGMGIGMAKELIEKLGGEIVIRSEEGKGTSTSFSLVLDYNETSKDGIEVDSLLPKAELLDFSELKEQFRGSEDTLINIINDFVTYLPKALREISEAISLKNSSRLEMAAASFYGVLGNFPAGHILELVIDLEKRGKFGQLDGSEEIYKELEEELDIFSNRLKAINISDLVA